MLNEAFLERFPVTFEQEYPTVSNEVKILERISQSLNVDDTDFCKRLVDWADIIRKTFYDGGIEEIISTRRLVHIIRAYSIFGNKAKAIEVCVNRFDDETKTAFMELYDKVDMDVDFEPTIDEEVWSPDIMTNAWSLLHETMFGPEDEHNLTIYAPMNNNPNRYKFL